MYGGGLCRRAGLRRWGVLGPGKVSNFKWAGAGSAPGGAVSEPGSAGEESGNQAVFMGRALHQRTQEAF